MCIIVDTILNYDDLNYIAFYTPNLKKKIIVRYIGREILLVKAQKSLLKIPQPS